MRQILQQAAAVVVVDRCQQQQEGRTRREDTKRKDWDAGRKCRSSASRSSLPLVTRGSSATRVGLFLRLDVKITRQEEKSGGDKRPRGINARYSDDEFFIFIARSYSEL